MNKYQEILKQYWGYDSFRDLQEEIITSIGEGKDTLGLMPTGGGKSITFQVPALAQEGICIVITPLIALMKDQVQNLRKREIKALAIYSGMTRQEILTALENRDTGTIAGSSGTGTDGYGHSGSRNRYSGPSEIPGRKCLPNEL